MIIRVFKSNQPILVFIMPLVAVLLWGFSLLYPEPPLQSESDMLLYAFINRLLADAPLFSQIAALMLVLVGGLLLNSITAKFQIFNKRSHLPALVYVILMSSLSPFQQLHPGLFANIFILLSVRRLLALPRGEKILSAIFDASFFLGIACLFYLPAISLVPVLFIALIIFMPFVWREWIMVFIGFLLPWLFTTVYYFWNDRLGYFLNEQIKLPFSATAFDFSMDYSGWITTGIVILICLLAFPSYVSELNTNTVRVRKTLILFIWIFLFSLLAFLPANSFSLNLFTIGIIPMSIYLTNFFLSIRKKWIAEILVWLLVLSILFHQYLHF